MASSTSFRRVTIPTTTPISIDLRNCKLAMIQNAGKSTIYLGSTASTLQSSMPEMFALLPRDNDAYAEKLLIFENPNELFDGP
ncbi:MAG TPA: hypothetical protein DCM40_19390, partial [Maribacter sp.]|nr:hypothetical protein [Maribacter sp.]